jgi:transcriptional regulator with XRE-family HTH domain
MKTTLSERLKEAMAGPPKITGRALAKACGIAPPSVSDWLSGKSKSMDGTNLIPAAELLKVRPKWLAEGVGPMRWDVFQQANAGESSVEYLPDPPPDPLSAELLALYSQLDREGKIQLLEMVKFFVAGRRPHQDGNASALAAK